MSNTTRAPRALTTDYRRGDFVLYRDPALYWGGKPDHTFACRVTDAFIGSCELVCLASGRVIRFANPEYMRMLTPEDAMADIDTAPLHVGDGPQDMATAANAWLAQKADTTEQPPQA